MDAMWLLLAGSLLQTPAAPTSDAIARRVDAALQPYVALDVFSGTVLLARGDSVLAVRAYGYADRQRGISNAPATQFRIASLSKPLTVTAIARLIDEGKLTPDARLSRFLPEYPRGDEITIEQLATHTSGVPHINSLPWYDESSHAYQSIRELIDRFINHPLDYDPGSGRAYSNGGYVLLAWVIEQVSGLPYGEFMQQKIFEPLGMASTMHEVSAAPPERLAQGYTIGLDGVEPAVDVDMSVKVGGGSIVSTAGDMFRWSRALRQGRFVKPAIASLFLSPRRGPRPSFYWTGHAPGFTAHLQHFVDDDVTVVVLSNNYARLNDEIAHALTAIAFDEPFQSGIGVFRGEPAQAESMPAQQLEPYVGHWLQHGPGPDLTFDLERDDRGVVYVAADRGERHRLIPIEPGAFASPLLWGVLRFDVPDGGEVRRGRWEWLDFDGFVTAVERSPQ